MRRRDQTLRSGCRLEKRPKSLRPPDKPLLPQRLRACQGRMSPDAVWQYGCAAKFAEPVSIQVPQHRAALSQRKRGPLKAVETALCSKKVNRADTVGNCLPSRPLIDRLSLNTSNVNRWCLGEETRSLSLLASSAPLDIYPFSTITSQDSFLHRNFSAGCKNVFLAVLGGEVSHLADFFAKRPVPPCIIRLRRVGQVQI